MAKILTAPENMKETSAALSSLKISYQILKIYIYHPDMAMFFVVPINVLSLSEYSK